MKSDTRNAYVRRIDAVLARLQAAIAAGDELPDLAELAAVAHLSPFHFHRVWRALTGETVGGTVARLRLSRALQLLGDAGVGVADVALSVGYETPQALSRAFRDRLDASPAELREDPARRAEWLARLVLGANSPYSRALLRMVGVRDVALGVGAYGAAIFHLFTHAFF